MNFEAVEGNSFKNPPSCFACLSSDRTLSPLGDYSSLFTQFFIQNSLTNPSKPCPISLCWECTAVLRKVKLFKEKVDHTQTVLSYHYLSKDEKPKCLTSLVRSKTEIISLQETAVWQLATNVKGKRENAVEPYKDDVQVKIERIDDTDDKNDSDKKYDDNIANDKTLNEDYGQGIFMLGWESDDGRDTDFFEYNIEVDVNERDEQQKKKKYSAENKPKTKSTKATKESARITCKTQKNKKITHETPEVSEKNQNSLIEIELTKTEVESDLEETVTDTDYNKEEYKSKVRKRKRIDSSDEEYKPEIKTESKPKSKTKRKNNSENQVSKINPKTEDNVKNVKEHDDHKQNSTKEATSKSKSKGKQKRRYRLITAVTKKITVQRVPAVLEEVRERMEKDAETDIFKSMKNKCLRCVKKVESVKQHKGYHAKSAKRKFICTVCEATFDSVESHQDHINRYHTTLLQCSECGYKCHLPEVMVYHRYQHNRKLQCLSCNEVFDDIKSFKKHAYVCDICGRRCISKDTLATHIFRNHQSHTCKVCNKTYKDYHMYQCHYSYKHVELAAKENAYCVTCDRQFHNERLYKTHVNMDSAHAAERDTRTPERFQCPECPNLYKNKYSFTAHYKFEHEKDYQFICTHCGKAFRRKSALDVHIKGVHERVRGPKDKICYICGRGFAENKTLRHHIRTHTGERPYKCEHCDARFAQRTAWKQHENKQHLLKVL